MARQEEERTKGGLGRGGREDDGEEDRWRRKRMIKKGGVEGRICDFE